MLAPFLLWDGLRHHLENSLLRGIFINNTKFSSFQAAHLQRLVLRSLAHPAANIIHITLEVEIGNRYSEQCYSFSSSMRPMSMLAQAPIYFYFLPFLPPLYLTPCISSDPQIAFISQKLPHFPFCRWENRGRGITRCLLESRENQSQIQETSLSKCCQCTTMLWAPRSFGFHICLASDLEPGPQVSQATAATWLSTRVGRGALIPPHFQQKAWCRLFKVSLGFPPSKIIIRPPWRLAH